MTINWNDAQGTYSQWLKATTAAGTMIQRMADLAGAMQAAEADLAGAEKRITDVYAELKKLTAERDGLTAEIQKSRAEASVAVADAKRRQDAANAEAAGAVVNARQRSDEAAKSAAAAQAKSAAALQSLEQSYRERRAELEASHHEMATRLEAERKLADAELGRVRGALDEIRRSIPAVVS